MSYFHTLYYNQEDKTFSLKAEKKKKWFLHSHSFLEAGASKKKKKIRKTMKAEIKLWVLTTLLQKGS